MKKHRPLLISFILFASCNQNTTAKDEQQFTPPVIKEDTTAGKFTPPVIEEDTTAGKFTPPVIKESTRDQKKAPPPPPPPPPVEKKKGQ